jgi:hypothetical protein
LSWDLSTRMRLLVGFTGYLMFTLWSCNSLHWKITMFDL